MSVCASSFINHSPKVWGPRDPVIEGLGEDDELIDGEKSDAVDDAKSTATCPVGKVRTRL